jgi:hypothetical protein
LNHLHVVVVDKTHTGTILFALWPNVCDVDALGTIADEPSSGFDLVLKAGCIWYTVPPPCVLDSAAGTSSGGPGKNFDLLVQAGHTGYKVPALGVRRKPASFSNAWPYAL